MSGGWLAVPRTNDPGGSAQIRIVPYPARARVVVERDDRPPDAWDQLVRLAPRVENLIELILALGILADERDRTRPDAGIVGYWRLVDELLVVRRGIDVAALERASGPDAPTVPGDADVLSDEIAAARQELEWLVPALEELTAAIDLVQRCLHEHRRHAAAGAIDALIGITERPGVRPTFEDFFRLWQSYRLDALGYLIDDAGRCYAHVSEFHGA
jgi:hypothetical protein